jgi:SAM-dependent methyltransferase
MKPLDRALQTMRINKAKKFIRPQDSVLDIGSADGVMFEKLRGYISRGTGVDPVLKQRIDKDFYTLLPGYFPEVCPVGETYDVITMLAVLEHIPDASQEELADNCYEYLRPAGRVIITVPSPRVDNILAILLKLRLIHGMSLEEHYGFKPEDTERIFSSPRFKLLHKSTFQLGLNNLFIFQKLEQTN